MTVTGTFNLILIILYKIFNATKKKRSENMVANKNQIKFTLFDAPISTPERD